MVAPVAQDILTSLDDETFCQSLVSLLHSTRKEGMGLLYEDWVLARLLQAKEQSPRYYYGLFLSPARALFPGMIHPPDLDAAMTSLQGGGRHEDGDVPPEMFADAIDEMFLHGYPKAYSAGWETLNPYYNVQKGQMTIVTGQPGHMKSTFVQGLCLNMARRHGWNFSMFSPEHNPLGSLGGLLIEAYMNQAAHDLEPADREHAKTWVTDRFHMMKAVKGVKPSLTWLLKVAAIQRERYGIEGVVLDPWNYIYHPRTSATKETDYIGDCLTEVHEFAEEHDVHVWIVAHPTKLQKAVSGKYSGQYPPATPGDINGSGNWFNKGDCCLSIWRNLVTDSPIIEVHIQKMRTRRIGRLGSVELRYDGRRFHDLGDMTEPHWTD